MRRKQNSLSLPKSWKLEDNQMTQVTLPTLEQLNTMDTEKSVLLLLRILNTSDLTFFHALFKQETCEEIVEVCQALLDQEEEYGTSSLTKEEKTEILQYMNNMDPEPTGENDNDHCR